MLQKNDHTYTQLKKIITTVILRVKKKMVYDPIVIINIINLHIYPFQHHILYQIYILYFY